MKKILLITALSLIAVACGKDDKNPFTNAKEAIDDKPLRRFEHHPHHGFIR